jgi:hypothetical protein
MADQWFVRVNDREYGPVELSTMHEWQREGRLIAQNEVRRGASADWQIAGAVEELFPPARRADGAVIRRRTWPELTRDTFRIYRHGFGQFVALALLTAVPSFLLQELVPFTLPTTLDGTAPSLPHVGPLAIAMLIVLIALWPISAAGFQLVADAAAHNERPRWLDLLRNSIRLAPRMLLLALLVYATYFFWLVIPFSAMLSLATAEPNLFSALLVLVIGVFTVYMNARLFINFLFWQQTAALSGLGGVEALRESKRLARSRPSEPPLQRPLYRGTIVASVWLLLLLAFTVAAQLPFLFVRFIGVTDPNEALAIAQKVSAGTGSDPLTLGANILAALLHILLRPLLAASFVLVYYDAKAGAPDER